jgi:hypothetical protein
LLGRKSSVGTKVVENDKNQAHNLKVVGSNPTPATNKKPCQLNQLTGLTLSTLI